MNHTKPDGFLFSSLALIVETVFPNSFGDISEIFQPVGIKLLTELMLLFIIVRGMEAVEEKNGL